MSTYPRSSADEARRTAESLEKVATMMGNATIIHTNLNKITVEFMYQLSAEQFKDALVTLMTIKKQPLHAVVTKARPSGDYEVEGLTYDEAILAREFVANRRERLR